MAFSTSLTLALSSAQTQPDYPAFDSPASVWTEVVETEPGRHFHSLLIKTIPGVDYQVEQSEDLETWSRLPESYYGLGQTVVVPLREQVMPAAPPPPTNPPPPGPRPIPATVMLRPAVGGGLVTAFMASGNREPVKRHLPGLIASSEWTSLPLYLQNNVTGYRFCIMFTSSPESPPESAPLDEADEAMLAALVTHSPDFDAEVQAHVTLARTRQVVTEYTPGLSADWREETKVRFTDTTQSGWTLAMRRNGDGENFTVETRLGLPLALHTAVVGTGMDNDSFRASDDTVLYPAAERIGNKDEFWLMIPAGGSLTVDVRSPACSTTNVKITEDSAKFTATPSTLSADDVPVTFTAPEIPAGGSDAGLEFPIPLAIGPVDNSAPVIKAKVMKPRTVQLTVWPLVRPGGSLTTLPVLPPEEAISSFFNDIFKPQLNLSFAVTIKPASHLPSDPGSQFLVAEQQLDWQESIDDACEGGDMRLFVLCDYDDVTTGPGGLCPYFMGWTYPAGSYAWMPSKGLTAAEHGEWLRTATHEMGHVLLGKGHPNNGTGVAPLPYTNHGLRLMCSSQKYRGALAARRVLVKAEWDKAHAWLISKFGN